MVSKLMFDIGLDSIRMALLTMPVLVALFTRPRPKMIHRLGMIAGGMLVFWGGFLDLTDEIPALDSIPILGADDLYHEHIKDTFGYVLGLMIFAISGTFHIRKIRAQDLAKIRAYERMLPICCRCGHIRTGDSEKDKETWKSLEDFMRSTGEVNFTDTYCPDCLKIERQRISDFKAASRGKRSPDKSTFLEAGKQREKTPQASQFQTKE